MLTFISPENRATVSLAIPAQELFRTRKEFERRRKADSSVTYQRYDMENCDEAERSVPAPVRIEWRFEEDPDTPDDLRGGSFFVLVSEKRDLSDPVVVAADGTYADVWNLKIGTRYYYCVQHEGRRSEIRHFKTKATAPRCILVEGNSNVRDLGGYKAGKKTIRQGLFYRGGEFERHLHIEEAGIHRLQALGIKTDLDLRGESIGTVEYPILPLYGIRRVLIPIGPYDSIFEEENRRQWHDIFKLLGDPENYPIYYHCWGGADRTGTLAFLVGALLGMSEKDLDFDYEYTSISIQQIRSQNFEPYVRMKQLLNACPGDTLAEKTANFLKKHFYLTNRDLEKIKKIFL